MIGRLTLLWLTFTATIASAAEPAPLAREFRAAWVATVANIDWPSKPGLPAQKQQKELIEILDKLAALKMNAVVLQVRPMCDAFYKSDLEPWSEFLTGTQGKDPGYDPLAFAIKEAHARGLELHAWFNPYRAQSPAAKSAFAANHLGKTRPDMAKKYGKHYWLNPTNAEVAKHTLDVFLDVVKRYDLDGIHMDDYFYPYTEVDEATKKEIPFPDDDTWAAYQKTGGKLSRGDWRRKAVDDFVEKLYKETKQLKPWVKVGISPFGIWRPGYPEGIRGYDQYDKLFADAKKWLNEGWIDYYTPQLYWPIKQEAQSYTKLLAWWVGENGKGRHMWPGGSVSRVNGEKGWEASEIINQIKATRAQKGASGNVHFSMKTIMKNPKGLTDALAAIYAEPALVPASPWLAKGSPSSPKVRIEVTPKGAAATITPLGEPARFFVIRSLNGDKWETKVIGADGNKDVTTPLGDPNKVKRLTISTLDRANQESPPVEVNIESTLKK